MPLDKIDQARRDMLMQAAGVLDSMRVMGAVDDASALRNTREFLAGRQAPTDGTVPAEVVRAAETERAWVLGTIEDALAGKGAPSGLGPLAWAERQFQERVWPFMMNG